MNKWPDLADELYKCVTRKLATVLIRRYLTEGKANRFKEPIGEAWFIYVAILKRIRLIENDRKYKLNYGQISEPENTILCPKYL